MLKLQAFLREMGMHHAIYIEPFEGPDVVSLNYRYAGLHHPDHPAGPLPYLGPILPTLVGRAIQEAAEAVADLGQIELARQKWGIPTGSGEGEGVEFKCKNRR